MNNFGKTLDGNGQQASFNYPTGIHFDSLSKNLIIVASQNIRKMNQSGLPLSQFHFQTNPNFAKIIYFSFIKSTKKI